MREGKTIMYLGEKVQITDINININTSLSDWPNSISIEIQLSNDEVICIDDIEVTKGNAELASWFDKYALTTVTQAITDDYYEEDHITDLNDLKGGE